MAVVFCESPEMFTTLLNYQHPLSIWEAEQNCV